MNQLTDLKRAIPDDLRPQILAAMKQDPILWEQFLAEPPSTGWKRLSELGIPPEGWTPAALGLLDAAPGLQISSLQSDRFPPVPPGLRHQAARAFEARAQAGKNPPPINFDEAVLLAVALRERRRLTGNWDGLADELAVYESEKWRTVLACLYGMIADPLKLLKAIIAPATPAAFDLAFHALLCQPMDTPTQAEILTKLLPSHEIPFLQRLSLLRPALAEQIAAQQAQKYSLPPAADPDFLTTLEHLWHSHTQIERCQLADNAAPLQTEIAHAEQYLRGLQSQIAQAKARAARMAGNPHALLAAWEQAYALDPESNTARGSLALALLDQGKVAEAERLLAQELDTPPASASPEIWFCLARLAAAKSESSRASQAAQACADAIQKSDAPSGGQLACRLVTLLTEIGLLPQAIQTGAAFTARWPLENCLNLSLAEAYLAANRPDEAGQMLLWALMLAPGEITLHRRYAELLEKTNLLAAALEERCAIARHTDCLATDFHALAACALRAQQPEQAIAACTQALAINTEDGQAHALLGQAFLATQSIAAAHEHLTLATLLAPYLPQPWLALAEISSKTGEDQKALETLRTGVLASPQSAALHHALGDAYLLANAPAQAVESLRRAAALDPENGHVALRLGQTLHRLGHLKDARRVLEQAYREGPPTPELASAYAQILLASGELSAALAPLQIVVESQPAEPSAYLDYACTLLTLRQNLGLAIGALQKALEIEPNLAIARAFLAEALSAQGDLRGALQTYQQALETGLGSDILWQARLSLGLGKTALALKQYDTGIAALHEAAQADPRNPEVYYWMTHAYLEAGLPQNALHAMRSVVQTADEDADKLTWFADTGFALIAQSNLNGLGPSAIQDLRAECAAARQHAAALNPERPDLIRKLAEAHQAEGDLATARQTLLRLPALASVSIEDLRLAARCLRDELGDPAAAGECLQAAWALLPADSSAGEEQAALGVDLSLEIAQTLHMACQPHAAAAALDRALAAAPAHHLPRLHAAKASLLRELGATQEALACIERALQTCPSDPLLHAAAAELMRQQHNLPAALQHALTAQNFALGDPLSTAEDLAALAELAASLAVSLLDFDQARQILISAAHSTPSMHLLLAELALEADEEVHAAEALTAAIETLPAPQESGDRQTFVTPNHLRTLALQARLAYRRGDPEMAQRMFQDALQIHREQEASSLITTQPPRFAEYPFWAAHALGNAAIDIGDWAAALWLAQRAFDLDTHQPLAQYQLAAALIHRAEAQRLCLAAEVVAHAPGEIALSEEALQCFSESIHAAAREASLAVSAGQPAETAPTPPAVRLQRLLARGLAAFDTRQNPTQLPVRTPAAIEHFWEARRAYEKGSLAQAQRSLEVALALWPNEARWHRLAADISAQAQQEAEYLAHLELAVELEPLHAGHRMALGHALLSLADGLPGALRAFEQACDLAPDELNPWMALAETQFKAGQLEAAAISAERAVNTAPDQLEPLLLRAQIALESHQPADAQEYAQAALSIYPADPTALLITSQALQALNRPEEGLEMIEHALPWGADCKDLSLPLQVQRIDLLRLTKGVETALPPASMLASSHPQSPAVLAVLAQTLADAGEHSQAVYTAQKALQQEKTQPEETGLRPAQKANLHYLLGSLLRRSGQLDQAIHHLQHCLEFAPRWLEPYLALGQAQQERRQYRKALASYQRAIAISPFDARPYLQAGLALKDGKDYREAEAMLRQAAELAPKDVSIRRQLAAVVALNLVHNPSRVGQTNSIEV